MYTQKAMKNQAMAAHDRTKQVSPDKQHEHECSKVPHEILSAFLVDGSTHMELSATPVLDIQLDHLRQPYQGPRHPRHQPTYRELPLRCRLLMKGEYMNKDSDGSELQSFEETMMH